METDPRQCNICDQFERYAKVNDNFKSDNYKDGILCRMVSDTKCGNSLCFNYDIESSNNCSRFGKVIDCKTFQKINQDSGGKE